MNPSTNELVDLTSKDLESKQQLQAEGFIPVPEALSRSARRHLSGKESVIVPKKSKSKLAQWAEKVRRNSGIKLDGDE